MPRRFIVFCLIALALLIAVPGVIGVNGITPAATAAVSEQTLVETTPIPEGAIHVCHDCAANDLQAAIDAAPESATLVVEGGDWTPITIDKPIRLIGQNWPLIDAKGSGSGIVISSSDVTIEGFEIRNSGRQFDKEDSGIYFDGQRNEIYNNRLIEVLFGINGATGHDSVIAGNYIQGQSGVTEGLRGDAIKVWYSHRVQIHHNRVVKGRDLLVWYSNEARVYENVVTESRYGFHFMNSDDGIAYRNTMVDNSVGIYVMYGKRFAIEDNVLQGSRGPSGHGLGLKEVDGIEVVGNVIYDNRIGVYNDNSPYSMNAIGFFQRNLIAYNDIGVGVLPSSRANIFTENSFIENLEQVGVLGSGQLNASNAWSQDGLGNFWSDYSGYDANGNGIGDVPYRDASMSEQLRRTHPQLQLFRFSLAESAVDFASQAMPFFATKPILEDDAPLVKPALPGNAPQVHTDHSPVRTGAISFILITGVAASLWWANKPARAASRLAEAA